MSQAEQLNEWDQPVSEATTTLEQMDAMIIKLRAARDHYDAMKEVATAAHDKVEAIEKDIINMLQTNKRSKYAVDGVAAVHIVSKEVYRTPKTTEEKRALFNYIQGKYGSDVMTSMLAINHNTLNSWANKETEAGVMHIPGLEAPTSADTLSMRRK